MEKIIEQIDNWAYLEKLPQLFHEFTLRVEKVRNETQYVIFSYTNTASLKKLTALYDSATKEYLVRLNIGLIEYFDINFIAPDLKLLQELLQMRLDVTLHSMAFFDPKELGSVFHSKKIMEWTFRPPEKFAGFKLFISPQAALKVINGSYVIINYIDLAEETQLLIYYNIFRDDFYAETVFRKTPAMITLFDAKTLQELEEKLKENLENVLNELRKRLIENE